MQNDRKSGRSLLANILLVLVVTLISLVLADLAFRAYERQFLVPVYPDSAGEGPVNLAQLRYNDGVVSRHKEPNGFRVLSFGDSFTYSVMEPELSYNGIVRQQLSESVPDQVFEVINLGEPGTGPNNFRAAYDFWSGIFEHDAVLFHIFLGNDVRDDAYLQAPLVWEPNVAVLQANNAFLDAGSGRVPAKFPLRMMDYAYAAWQTRKTTSAAELPAGYNWAALTELDDELFAETYFRFLDNHDPARLPELFPGYQQVMLLLQRAQEIAASGKRVAVILGPSEPMVNDKLRSQVLAEFGADPADYDMGLETRIIENLKNRFAPDVPMLDLTPAFRQRHRESGEQLYFRQNTHWDQAGNRLAGDHIADFLLQSWFQQSPSGISVNDSNDPEWPGPMLVSQRELDAYLAPMFSQQSQPEVSGAARVTQLFDGITGESDNWAMAELGQAVVLRWEEPVRFAAIRLYLHNPDGRSYGFLLEAESAGKWQTVLDRRDNPASGILDIEMPATSITALRITGSYNSKQETNPANTFIHIEEVEFLE